MKFMKSSFNFCIIHSACISSQFFWLKTSHPCLEHPVPAIKVHTGFGKKHGQWSGYLHTNTSAPHPTLIVKHSPCGVSPWAVEDLETSPDTDQHYRASVSSVVGTGNFCLILFLHGFLSVLQWWLNSKSKNGQNSYSSPKCSPSTLQQEQLKESGN